MGSRYTPLNGEEVCLCCGEVLVEVSPVVPFEDLPSIEEQVRRAAAIERAAKTHVCGSFVDWDWAMQICEFPHQREDVLICKEKSRKREARHPAKQVYFSLPPFKKFT